MRIMVEVLTGRREEAVELGSSARGLDLLRALRLAPDAHILIRDDAPIPADASLQDGERIRIIGVASGGSPE